MRLRVLTAALAIALVAACTSDEGGPEVAPSAPPEPAGTAAPPSGAAPGSDALPDQVYDYDPEAAPPVHRPMFGSWIIDVATGEVARLGDDANSLLMLRDGFQPGFTPDGSGVWLRRGDWTDARRYGLDGGLTESIEGAWAVIESADGRSRAYYLRGSDGVTSDLVAERDGDVHRVDGRHALPAFSPDGLTLAFYAISDDNVADLVLLGLDSGATRIVATEVDPCACDLTPHPEWSPSGTHIAYYDFEGNEDGSVLPGATFLVDAASGEIRWLADNAPPGDSSGWLSGNEARDCLAVTHFDAASIFDVATNTDLLAFARGSERMNRVRVVSEHYLQIDSVIPERSGRSITTLIDGLAGEQLARWELGGETTMMADGPTLA